MTDRIKSGEPFAIVFDGLLEAFGTIQRRGEYLVTFRPADRSWSVSGPKHPEGYQANIISAASAFCDPDRQTLCVWGASFGFDDQARVLQNGQPVGRIRSPATVKDRVKAGEPFVVLFDALDENIGTIKPSGRYDVAFQPADRSWRASGPRHDDGVELKDVVHAASSVCNPDEDALCIWGAAFRFDDQGQVFAAGNRRIGRIQR